MFHNPVAVHMGRGSLERLPGLLRGRRAALLTSPGMARRGVVERVRKLCGDALVSVVSSLRPLPTRESVAECRRELGEGSWEVLVALGGGSVLDAAKAVAHAAGFPPIIAVPTTAGTGSEVTCWAALWDPADGSKSSLEDPALYAEAAIVDASLTDTLDYENTLMPALDALSHSMEAVWNLNANPVSDALACAAAGELMAVFSEHFQERFQEPLIRDRVQRASLLAGLAFSATHTALCHSISYPLTGRLGVPHGLACSLTLPEVLLRSSAADAPRLRPLLRALSAGEDAHAAAETLYGVFERLGVPGRLARHVPEAALAARLDAQWLAPGRAGNALFSCTDEEARALLARALGRLLTQETRP